MELPILRALWPCLGSVKMCWIIIFAIYTTNNTQGVARLQKEMTSTLETGRRRRKERSIQPSEATIPACRSCTRVCASNIVSHEIKGAAARSLSYLDTVLCSQAALTVGWRRKEPLVEYMKKLLDIDWLRAVQFKFNTSAKSVTPVQITNKSKN